MLILMLMDLLVLLLGSIEAVCRRHRHHVRLRAPVGIKGDKGLLLLLLLCTRLR